MATELNFYLGAEYLLYEAKYNERFNKSIPALKIIKDSVENYKHLTMQSDILSDPMTPDKLDEIIKEKTQETSSKLKQKFFINIILTVGLLFFIVALFFVFSLVQILVLVCFVLIACGFYIVNSENIKLKLN